MESGVKGVPHAITYGGTVSSRLTYNVSCGPLKRSREWLATRIMFVINDSDNSPEGADGDELNAAECRKILAFCLLASLPSCLKSFSRPIMRPTTVFVLHNHDLHMGNILCRLECIHTFPLWLACQLTGFFQGQTRHEVLIADDYSLAK